MSKFDVRGKVVAECIGALLKVAGEQMGKLSDYGLMLTVEADGCKGWFKAQVWSRIDEFSDVRSEVVEVQAEAGSEKDLKGEAKPESPKPKSLDDKSLKSNAYLS